MFIKVYEMVEVQNIPSTEVEPYRDESLSSGFVDSDSVCYSHTTCA
jgi:hypothetical protein